MQLELPPAATVEEVKSLIIRGDLETIEKIVEGANTGTTAADIAALDLAIESLRVKRR